MKTGPKWSAHRRIVNRFLTDNYLQSFAHVTEEEIEVLFSKWDKVAAQGGKTNAHYDLSMTTLDVIMRCAFDIQDEFRCQTVPEQENHLFHGLDVALREIVLRTVLPLWRYVSPRRFQVDKIVEEQHRLSQQVFDESVARLETNADAPPSMLDAMLKATKEDGSKLSPTEIRDELLTVRGAGSETTSNTLCWALYLLSKPENAAVLTKLRGEVDAGVKGDTCTYEEAKQLTFTSKTMFETLRMFPTVPSFPRECHEDIRLPSGYDVPRGSLVFVSQRPLNYNPELWDKPFEFNPDRFGGKDGPAPELHMSRPVGAPGGPSYGFVPFGGAFWLACLID